MIVSCASFYITLASGVNRHNQVLTPAVKTRVVAGVNGLTDQHLTSMYQYGAWALTVGINLKLSYYDRNKYS